MNNFGIIIVCSGDDYIFAKGCAASSKYFMPDVPLCLIVDGNFDLEGLPELYDAIVIKKDNIENHFLRTRSFGWGLTKMIAFWESPFEKFFLLDSDTNFWGDITTKILNTDYDIIVDQQDYKYEIEGIEKWFFKIDKIKCHFPDFDPLMQSCFSSGAFYSKKNILDINTYKSILDLIAQDSDIFPFGGEMGFLNYMILDLAQRGKINLGRSNLQYMTTDYHFSETVKKFEFKDDIPNVNGLSVIVHWPGDAKPIPGDPYGYHGCREPMTFFRKQYLRDSTTLSELEIEKEIIKEEKDRFNNIRKSRLRLKAIMIAKSIINRFTSLNS